MESVLHTFSASADVQYKHETCLEVRFPLLPQLGYTKCPVCVLSTACTCLIFAKPTATAGISKQSLYAASSHLVLTAFTNQQTVLYNRYLSRSLLPTCYDTHTAVYLTHKTRSPFSYPFICKSFALCLIA
jgi:hypothetical protein